MVADWTDKENWVLGDFLFEIGQSSIPSYPIILGSKNGVIKFLTAQLSPPAITPQAGKKKFIDQLELFINS
ncbi:MAG: hypothetical protein VXW02_01015 [Verrucomicrobiota bacterium]|nr:hypothetical protein [Verrucomicrobiota bacterium]